MSNARLGGTPALTMVLHTWTRQLAFHPHLHAIVSAGAMNEDGAWLHSRKDYLFPVKVMARLFRRLFREALLVALDKGELNVAPEHDGPMRKALFQTRWLVYAKAPFGGADQVFAYLGRYTHRVGISNARIQSANERAVSFATKNGRSCTLTPLEFLRRFLLHVLLSRFHKIRHYGLCASHHVAHGAIEMLRDAMLRAEAPETPVRSDLHNPEQPSAAPPAPATWLECLLALTGIDAMRCPRCTLGRFVAVLLPSSLSLPERIDSS